MTQRAICSSVKTGPSITSYYMTQTNTRVPDLWLEWVTYSAANLKVRNGIGSNTDEETLRFMQKVSQMPNGGA